MPVSAESHSHRNTTKSSHKPFKARKATKGALKELSKGMHAMWGCGRGQRCAFYLTTTRQGRTRQCSSKECPSANDVEDGAPKPSTTEAADEAP